MILKKKEKKIKHNKTLMNNTLKLQSGYIIIFIQKNQLKNLRGIIKCYTFASL